MPGASSAYTRRFIVDVGIATLTVLLVLAVWMASHVLLLIFGGILLAVLLRGLGDRLSAATGIPPGWSALLSAAVLVSIFGFGAWYLSGEIAGQFDELASSLTAMWQQAREHLSKYG
ncbi:MAG: AI-2E family transporter, partial [Burkholderiales bacterium]